jgi:tryptophan synthase alpha chain
MSRLSTRFRDLAARGERALIPFLTAGDPDLATTEKLLHAVAAAGADAIEIGVPFSDPMAEGPTIQRSSERALRTGVSLRRILEMVRENRSRLDVPLVLMGYANNFLALEPSALAEATAAAGVDGVIVVDLPPEEGEETFAALRAAGVDPILLAAPTTTPERARMLAEKTRGFLYYVSLTGVTGARSEVAVGVEESVRALRMHSDIPICVGFGVSTPEHVREVGAYADGVVVGSALVARIEEAHSSEAAVEAVSAFVAEMKAPLRAAGGGD